MLETKMEGVQDDKAERISITLPKNILEDLGKTMREIGIKKRSMAVRKAVELFVRENEALRKKGEEESIGTVSYIYNHEKRDLLDKLLDIQHHFGKIIISTVHIHLDPERCFETLIIRGETKMIKELINELRRVEATNLAYQLT